MSFSAIFKNISTYGPYFTVVSPHIREEIAPFDIEEATYVPNSVFTPDQDDFEPIRKEHDVPKDATVVFNVSSFTNQQRPVRFAGRLRAVAADLKNTHVVMTSGGPLREAVETRASK